MNTLLIFFAFPIAVIIISIILQKLLNNPIAVAALIFAIFIVVAFAAFDETFLIAVLAYTILALVTALIVSRFCEDSDDEDSNCLCDTLTQLLQDNATNTNNISTLLRDLLGNSNSSNGNTTSNSNNFSNNTNSNNNNSITNSNNFSNNTNSNNNNSFGTLDDDDNVLINNCNCGCGRRYRRF